MFGAFPITPNLPSTVDPDDVPDPTPITLPRYQPFAKDSNIANTSLSLPNLLKETGRESIVLGRSGLLAIGLDLTLDAQLQDLLPTTSCLPDFACWDNYSPEQARKHDAENRIMLRNGAPSPGCHVYSERRRELANTNEDAFRTVRRVAPPKGKQQARLGNAYEFFRCLELFTAFWDDPSEPQRLPPSPELTASEAEAPAEPEPRQPPTSVRSSSGASMPAEYRQNLLNTFIKLVAYDFGCNVSMARVEPRLHLQSPPGEHQRKSYTPSNCHFVFQSPATRETARAGVIYGPVAAVSARPSVDFTTPDVETAQSQDLAREVTAALITAQHRNREGKEEVRFGHEKWWTANPRWGGGAGGPIGREIERGSAPAGHGDNTSAGHKEGVRDGTPANKKARRNMPIYDNYRMVRPPASSWDRKAKYEAIGKVADANYDDVFVMSSLFHHMSILRVRVPTRLLDVLDGSPEPDAAKRSWGKVEAWRSPWFDFFQADQRTVAMQLVWAVMAYQMRSNELGNQDADHKS